MVCVLRKLDGRSRITVLITATPRRLTCFKWNRNAVARLYKIAHPVWMFSCNFHRACSSIAIYQKRRLSRYLAFADALNARAEIVEKSNSNQPLGDDPLHLSPE